MGLRPHTICHVRNDNIREMLKAKISQRGEESKTGAVRTREETSETKKLRKQDSRDGTTWEKNKRKTEA